ncbi:hypothetical protein AALP_AA5G007900 [Arabis alpina]|uniref:Gnk2-homologous domain-containing protein n=1 Tax=Arabis alpina TaxID=50452 RepID=A0A087GU48_ARAAL|nr:hypothetical protein AALP_AA5G007900 [Arabis alpina]
MTNAYLHHKCYVSQGMYKPGSEYEKLRNEVIRDVPKGSNFGSGFEMSSSEQDFGFVSVIHQCRGDSYGPKCRSCYATALAALQRKCPRGKGGIIWYDQCFLEFNAIDSFRKIDYDNNFCMSNTKNVSGDKQSYSRKWMQLLQDMSTKAFRKNKSYAAGEERLGKNKLYGMLQCTGDTTFKSCRECYVYNFIHFQDCIYGKQGARVLGRSCNFRFELYPFVGNETEPI